MKLHQTLYKKFISLALLLGLVLGATACSKNKEIDGSLDGVWQATIEDPSTHEKFTYFYEFDDKNVKIIKSLDTDAFTNSVELRVGTYKRGDDVNDEKQITISFATESCKGLQNDEYVLGSQTFRYKVSLKDMNELTMSFGLKKDILLTRVSDDIVDYNREVLKSAAIGCFVTDNFSGKTKFKRVL